MSSISNPQLNLNSSWKYIRWFSHINRVKTTRRVNKIDNSVKGWHHDGQRRWPLTKFDQQWLSHHLTSEFYRKILQNFSSLSIANISEIQYSNSIKFFQLEFFKLIFQVENFKLKEVITMPRRVLHLLQQRRLIPHFHPRHQLSWAHWEIRSHEFPRWHLPCSQNKLYLNWYPRQRFPSWNLFDLNLQRLLEQRRNPWQEENFSGKGLGLKYFNLKFSTWEDSSWKSLGD